MKKILSLLLILILAVPAAAAWPEGYVTDSYGLLEPYQAQQLEEQARLLSERYDCGIYILTTADHTQYGSSDPYDAAVALYLAEDLGRARGGVLLMLSMNSRDAVLVVSPEAEGVFSPARQDDLAGKYLSRFREGSWLGGFEAYLEGCAGCLERGAAKAPGPAGGLVVSLVLGFAVAALIMLGFRLSMRSVSVKTSAGDYVSQGGIHITNRQDTYLRTDRRVRHIERSGGSGGSRRSGGGFSGRSDKF